MSGEPQASNPAPQAQTPSGSTPTSPPSGAPAPGGPQSVPGALPAASVPANGGDAADTDWGAFAGLEPDSPYGEEPQPAGQPTDPSAAQAAEATTVAEPAIPTPALAEPQQPDPTDGKAKSDTKSPHEVALETVNSPEWQAEKLKQLAQGYQLSEEEANAFQEDPVKAIPDLMAKAHLRLAFQMTQMVETMFGQMLIPQIQHQLQSHEQVRERRQVAQEVIFKPYPKLKEVSQEVMASIINVVKATSPATMSGQDKLARVARMAYEANGWAFPGTAAAPRQSTPAAPSKAPPGMPPISPPAAGSMPSAPNGPQPTVDAQGEDWSQYIDT